MFRDFAPKTGYFFFKFSEIFLKMDPCLGIFCQKPTHLGGTSPYSVSMGVPPPPRSIIRSANYHLTNISRARKMLTTEAAQLAVHTLVTSRLDYCNSLFTGINKSLITRLQNVQRTSARVIVMTLITPELIALHWLPHTATYQVQSTSSCLQSLPQAIAILHLGLISASANTQTAQIILVFISFYCTQNSPCVIC